MKKIKSIIVIIGSLFINSIVIAKQLDVTGLYDYRGSALFLFPQNQMVIMGYGTIITGKYIIENDELSLKFDHYPSVMAIIPKINQVQTTNTTIEISSDLVDERNYIGTDINLNQSIMTKIVSSNVACEGKDLKFILANSEFKNLIVSLAENDFTGEPAVSYKIQIPNKIQKIKLIKHNSYSEFETVFKIKENTLIDTMDGKVLIKQSFSAISTRDFEVAKRLLKYRQNYEKDLKIYQGDGKYIQTLKSEVVYLNSPKLNGNLKMECEVD